MSPPLEEAEIIRIEEEIEEKIHPLVSALTGADNKSHDVAKWIALGSAFSAIIYEGYVVFTTGTFNIIDFGVGMAALIGGMGAAIKLKESAEPKPN
jgi:hypothetical protein